MRFIVAYNIVQSCPTLCNPWTAGHQARLSMGFSRPEYWSGLPFPSPWDLPNPEIKPGSPALQAASLLSELLYTYIYTHMHIHTYLYLLSIWRDERVEKQIDFKHYPDL